MPSPNPGDRVRVTCRRIVEFHAAYTLAHGYPPAIEEVRDALKLWSNETAHHLIHACLDAGYLHRPGSLKRAVTVKREPKQYGDLRLVWKEAE